MFEHKMTRRDMLRTTGLAILGSAFAGLSSSFVSKKDEGKMAPGRAASPGRPFRVSLNVSTISGYKLPVEQQIDLCAEAGFDGIELWAQDVEAYISRGGSYEALRRRLESSGLRLENMIAFFTWFADEPSQRKEGLRQMRHDMEMVAALGGKYIAAPAQGVERFDRTRMLEYIDRYRAALDLGDEVGVSPILELWGAGVLNQLSDTMAIAIGAGHPRASVLLDFYHLYRGGNDFDGLRLVNGKMLPVFHINDYPSVPPREKLNDSDRVFPGDGICPFKELLPLLYNTGFRGAFSIELFNKKYWETMDVKEVLRQSYNKTCQLIDDYSLG